jgi:hypothetical protein
MDQFNHVIQHKTDPNGFLINKFQRISALNQQVITSGQARQFSIEHQSPQRFIPQKDMVNGLNGRHLNPMNASINQTTTNKDRPSRVAVHNTEEDFGKSNEFASQKKKHATKLPNDILLSPKKVQSELQNMMVMQQIDLMH